MNHLVHRLQIKEKFLCQLDDYTYLGYEEQGYDPEKDENSFLSKDLALSSPKDKSKGSNSVKTN